ncbi:FAD dependent oxidoreductase [Kalaharituber pfeilii]|nr:FAD dependent oxidoreductase [Kalaharituber pfeilii]
MTVTKNPEKKNIIIIGGGIIGCTTAYYLTRHPSYDPQLHTITLLEATRIAGGASGKAGGLLAIWAYPNNIVPLSFKLHEDLAKEHNGAEVWGYRRVTCGGLEAEGTDWSEVDGSHIQKGHPLGKRTKGGAIGKAKGVPQDLDWIVPEQIKGYEEIGDTKATAQVHPYHFTTTMIQLAEEKGVKVIYGSVTELNYEDVPGNSQQATSFPSDYQDSDPPSPTLSSTSLSSASSFSPRRKAVNSVVYVDRDSRQVHTLPATTTILAAGPWTAKLYASAPISGLRAHSVTITPTEPVSAYALFTKITIPPRPRSPFLSSSRSRSRSPVDLPAFASPEIYARPNEIYVCGEGDMDVGLPATTADVQVDEVRCDELISQVASISNHIRNGIVTRKQACYLPIVNIGGLGPLIGETGIEGLLLASGHSCWGINNAPATGVILSEIVFDGKAKSADIRSMDPRRVI